MTTDRGIRPQQRANTSQKVAEVQRAGGGLQLLVNRRGTAERLLESGGKVGVGVATKGLRQVEQRVASAQHLGTRDLLRCAVGMPEDTVLVTIPFARPREA